MSRSSFIQESCAAVAVTAGVPPAVAAGILPAVEGGILPPELSRGAANASAGLTHTPPGETPGSTAGGTPAATMPSRSMRLVMIVLALAFVVQGLHSQAAQSPALLAAHAQASLAPLAALPLYFEPGTAPGQFVAQGDGYDFQLSPGAAQLVFGKFEESIPPDIFTRHAPARPRLVSTRYIRMEFLGAATTAEICGTDKREATINYFLGKNPDQWRVGVPTYGKVRVEGLYPGIDLIYYGGAHQLEYDFSIAPGTDPGVIAIHILGADTVAIDENGTLLLSLGSEQIRQPLPAIYQVIDGNRRPIRGGYCLKGPDVIGFAPGEYDRMLPLTIDPVLGYASYFGGKAGDVATSVKVDGTGAVYVAGITLGDLGIGNFAPPGSVPGFITTFQGGRLNGDAYVAKLDNNLTNLLFLSYIGGTGDEGAFDMAIDTSNNVYLTGFTDSTNFPVLIPNAGVAGLTNAMQISGSPSTNRPFPFPTDAFVTELGAAGTNLVYSLYLGAEADDIADGIAVDSQFNAYITGYTHSTNFPMVNPYQTNLVGTNNVPHIFVAKIGAGATNLAYSSYFGGTNLDHAEGIAVDPAGFAYVTGFTASTNFPTTPDAFQSSANLNHATNAAVIFIGRAPPYDGFLAKFDTTTSGVPSLVYSSLLGGTNIDAGYRVAVDPLTTNVYVTGFTESADFTNNLIIPGLYSSISTNFALIHFNSDAFLASFGFGSSPPTVQSTVFGGTNNDVGWDVAVIPNGAGVGVVGITASTNFPTLSPYGSLSGTTIGANDAFVTVFTNDLSAVYYSVILGGIKDDFGYGIAFDADTNAFVVGRTLSTNFPVTGPIVSSLLSSNNAFLAKIVFTNQPLVVTFDTTPTNLLIIVDEVTNQAPFTITNWTYASVHTISVPPVQIGPDGLRYLWTNWSDKGTLTHQIAPTRATNYTANFLPLTGNEAAFVINGPGTLSPNLNGRALVNGSRYNSTAVPASGALFLNWAGSAVTNVPTLNFIMQTGLVFQANFITNPFVPLIGSYAGLFYPSNDITFQSSGFFSASLAQKGSFSARIQLAGKSYSLSGLFATDGTFSNAIPRSGLAPLSVSLQLDFATGKIHGAIGDNTFSATLLANRYVFSVLNLAPQSGVYTLGIPGNADPAAAPAGFSAGTVQVGLLGNLLFSATLGDGTKISQSTFISSDGLWPFYASLYSGKGSILGWLSFNPNTNTDIMGSATWFKLPQPAAHFYPAGFTLQTNVLGSFFTPNYYLGTNGITLLNFTNGQVVFQGANLLANITNSITISTNNRVTNLSSNKLSLSLNTTSGQMSGSVLDPITRKTFSFSGVLLQKQDFGAGTFLGTNQSGSVLLLPR